MGRALGVGEPRGGIRLAGIDFPERGQAFGTKAKEALLARVGGQDVPVEWEERDRYGRVVGKVIDDRGDVNLDLVRAGMCSWYRKYAGEQSVLDQVLYMEAEASSRVGRVGLWRNLDPAAVGVAEEVRGGHPRRRRSSMV